MLKCWKKKSEKIWDTEELEQRSQLILDTCVNEWNDEYKSFYHHLPLKCDTAVAGDPDNWDLPAKQIEEFKSILAELDDYATEVNRKYYSPKNPTIADSWILPPWIVFPHIPNGSIFWRMGSGETYMDSYMNFINLLSEEEFKQYSKRYPSPKYMSGSSFAANHINHYLRSKDRASPNN